MLRGLFSDISFAFRMLSKTPGFTLAAVLTLALAIGANTAMFTVVDAVLLAPLPYSQPDRLVVVWERLPSGMRNVASTATFLDWQRGAKSFAELAAGSGGSMTLIRADRPEDVSVARVTPNYFKVLGLPAAIGRTFVAEDGLSGREHSVLLTHALWKNEFGEDPSLVGRTLSLDGEAYTVLGILPANTLLDDGNQQIFAPLVLKEGAPRNEHWLAAYGRLAPGATLASAQAEMNVLAAAIAARFPDTNGGWGAVVDPLRSTLVGNTLRTSLLLLFGAVGFILLVGAANVANLMLVRATGRQKEFSIRAALGASTWRLARQFLSESFLLAAFGVAGAVLLGAWLLAAITAIMPSEMLPAGMTVHMNARVLLFTCSIGAATALLFGLLPALQSARVDLNHALKEEARGSGASRGRRQLRNALVVAEVAIAFCLLTGAALLLTSLAKLLQVNPGFNPQNVLAAHISLPQTRYAGNTQIVSFFRRAEAQLRAIPGVKDVAFSTDLPLRGWAVGAPFEVEGHAGDRSQRPFAHLQWITNAYFQTLQIQMLRGRAFSDSDNERSRPVIVVNQTLAEKFFPGQDPVGQHLVLDFGPGDDSRARTAWEIVGVSTRVKVENIAEAATRAPEVYFPAAQSVSPMAWVSVRAAGDPALLQNAVADVFRGLDPTLPLTRMGPLDVVLQRASVPARFRLRLFGAFAALGLALAAVGIFSVRSYVVGQRVGEIGIRMALGATPGRVLQVFLAEGAWIVGLGIACGAALSLALTRTMASLLFAVQANDPVIFLGCALLMAAIGMAASLLPARSAAKVDPIKALSR